MKISLLSYEFVNNDVRHNIRVIINAIKEASDKKIDMIIFGESFLQGFDSLSWNYDKDQDKAVFLSSYELRCIRSIASRFQVACAFGYFENFKGRIFSSYLVVDKNGNVLSNYRRRSIGWKEYKICDEHYGEGNCFDVFELEGKRFVSALCGDLWDDDLLDEISKLDVDVILWPVYVNFSEEKWIQEKEAYLNRIKHLKPYVLLVNSYTQIPLSIGGSFVYKDGKILLEGKRGQSDNITLEL
ncbi:carbon-nitrogen hydrolase family protein [uncultured Traorella sp.]|uniref:carbon-nitrogen hydrolase family protein n=1 Tax=uncultured Traorella sp. TaxID=1929048 RepID=UPI0025D50381|nr:carbon-nitrogen hydrolase family protein [uncultured Traorella sp.]